MADSWSSANKILLKWLVDLCSGSPDALLWSRLKDALIVGLLSPLATEEVVVLCRTYSYYTSTVPL